MRLGESKKKGPVLPSRGATLTIWQVYRPLRHRLGCVCGAGSNWRGSHGALTLGKEVGRRQRKISENIPPKNPKGVSVMKI